jgi:ATP-dependent exoDNAse (exonuclease V) beta subunit
VIRDSVEKARVQIPIEHAAEIASVTAAAGQKLVDEGRNGEAISCIGLTQLPNADNLDAWVGIVETLLKKDNNWRRQLTVANGFPTTAKALKQRGQDLIARLSTNDTLRLALAELRLLPDRQFAEAQWQALEALVKLLPVAAAELQVQFRQTGEADYAEIAMAAQRALGEAEEPTDLALSLDYQVQHLLVDEFQDTSVSQFNLLEKLTAGWQPGDGRTIFAVGDPMQSIYRFREAEVGLFLKACREGIGNIRFESLRLSTNFRSAQGVVDWVNETFPSVLPAEEDITTGSVPFCPSDAVNSGGQRPAITIHPFVGRDDDAEARRVVELVRDAQTLKVKKVAILVRARSHLSAILPALRNAGLRFRAVEIHSLAQVPLIQDLTALTRALLHSADRIAWLAVLRAPWCGLTLTDLHALAGLDLHATIWDLVTNEEKITHLTADSRERLVRVREVLKTALETRPASLRGWVEGTWMALGGPACAADPADLDNAQAFFDLLEQMETGAGLELAAFSERVEGLYANPDPEADEFLQIMSIHKAKGLEFDVVILPGLGRKTRSDESHLMLWLERPRLGSAPDLLLAPIHAIGADRDRTYDYLKLIDSRKAEYEVGRLLYVAATRAKSELHLLGHTAFGIENGAVELKLPESSSLLRRLWTAAEPVFQKVAGSVTPAAENAAEVERVPQAIERLSREWRLPSPLPNVAIPEQSAGVEQSEPETMSFHWVGDTLRHVGTVVHQMLRRIAEDGLSRWNSARIEQHRPAYRSALLSLGLSTADVPAGVDKVANALTRTLADERGKWLLDGNHVAAVCEYPLSGVLGGELVDVRVDRTFIDEDGTRWIVDYKTSSHEGADVEGFLDNERERYRAQVERYRRLFVNLEGRPTRVGLYFPLLNGWREVAEVAAANSAVMR